MNRFAFRGSAPGILLGLMLGLSSCQDSPVEPPAEPQPQPVSIQITPERGDALIGDTLRFQASLQSDRGGEYTLPEGATLAWSVSDTTVARLLGEGASVMLVAKSVGTVEVQATYGNLSAKSSVVIQDFPALSLAADQVLLTTLGDTANLPEVKVGDRILSEVTLTRISEQPWLDSLEVSSVTGTRIVALAPGSSLYQVSAPRSKPDTLHVQVRPGQPLVYAFAAPRRAGTGDTLRIRGYLPGLAGSAVSVNGAPVTVLSQDSANLRFSVSTLPISPCGIPARSEVHVSGARSLTSLQFSRKRAGEIQLEIGQAMDLNSEHLACLRTPALQGSEYILAFVDPTRIEQEKITTAPYAPTDTFRVSVQDLLPPLPSLAPSRALARQRQRVSARGPDFSLPLRSVERPWDRTTPYAVGDTFSVEPMTPSWPDTVGLQVIKIYDNWAVLAVPRDEVSLWKETRLEAAFDTAMIFMLEDAIPYFQRVFQDGRPTTGGTGQELLIAKRGQLTGSGSSGRAGGAWTEYNYAGETRSEHWVAILGHELGHRWHFMERRARGTAGIGWGGFAKWHVEGLGDYLEGEALRRFRKLPFLGQNPLSFFNGDPVYNQSAHGNGKYFIGGYQPVNNFLRDLTQRLQTEHGLSHEAAVRTVAKGAAAGWYGCDGNQECNPEGLVEIMSRVTGTAWDPADAMLTWVLTQQADDLVSNPKYQNLTWKEVSSRAISFPLGEVSAGSGSTAADHAYISAATYFRLHDAAVGGAFQVRSENAKLRWRLLRLR